MNILVPHDWLSEYLDGDVAPSVLQKELSLRGPSVERIINGPNQTAIFDIEVTTNRVDSMCIRGLAREAAVILQQETKLPIKFLPNGPVESLSLEQFEIPKKTLPLPKITIETDKVNRTLCVILDQVQHAATPATMARRLIQIEENIHDAIVDITNYITHELGHPCHAFDYDKVMKLGGEIIIKVAAPNQAFTTLDGNTYKTVGGEVIFTNPAGEIIDLPAIKGALNTAIDEKTTRVLFWLENLDAMTVRRASMSHAIRTVAATLNEKSVDPHLASATMARGLQLFQEICGAKIASEIYDYFPDAKQPLTQITLRWQRLTDYLGITEKDLTHQQVITYLHNLGLETQLTDDGLIATVPNFRTPDLQIEVDLIEEIARIYGYHNLPSTLNFPTVAITPQPDFDFNLERRIKENLSSRGYFEVYTSSLVSEAQANAVQANLDQYLKVSNPLTADKIYLRQSLIPSLQEVFTINKITAKQNLSAFELAKVYLPSAKKDLTHEEVMRLTLVSNQNYRQVLTDFYQLLEHLLVETEKLELKTDPQQENRAQIFAAGEVLAEISVDAANRSAIECALPVLQKLTRRYPAYQPINHQPSLIEDLTFTIPLGISVSEILQTINNIDNLIVKVALSDIYERNFTFTITYQSHRILENRDVAPIRQKIVDLLAQQKITLVGKLSN